MLVTELHHILPWKLSNHFRTEWLRGRRDAYSKENSSTGCECVGAAVEAPERGRVHGKWPGEHPGTFPTSRPRVHLG